METPHPLPPPYKIGFAADWGFFIFAPTERGVTRPAGTYNTSYETREKAEDACIQMFSPQNS